MSLIYITGYGTLVGIDHNRLSVKYRDGTKQLVPIETVEGITVLGRPQFTSACMMECLKRGIPVSFLSAGGKYFGRLMSTGHVNAELQRKQSSLYHTDFALSLSRNIIDAKINNQLVVLRRYARSKGADIHEQEAQMHYCMSHARSAATNEELMGYEGTAARSYFAGLSACIDPAFAFLGRSRRPPRDEFNSLISLGYSILLNEIYTEIEAKGLNPYFGFMHQDHEHHPTLASDLMEEWRAVIVDSLAMSMINGHEITKNEFEYYPQEPGSVYVSKDGLKIFAHKLEEKLKTRVSYLSYSEEHVTFKTAMDMQTNCLARAIMEEKPELYMPLRIR